MYFRDRTRLKKRKSRRKNAKEINDTERCNEGTKKEDIRAIKHANVDSQNCRSPQPTKVSKAAASSDSKAAFQNIDLSAYSMGEGIDNLAFRQSNSNINVSEENKYSSSKKTLTNNENVTPVETHVLENAVSHEKMSDPDIIPNSHPSDCFIIRKITRRHSYEVAISKDSWMPLELPCCTKTKLDNSNIDENKENKECKKTVNFSFENQAYDNDDFENT